MAVTDFCTHIHYNFTSDFFVHGGGPKDKPCSLTRKRMGKSVLADRGLPCIFSVTKLCILFMRQKLLQLSKLIHDCLAYHTFVFITEMKQGGIF